MVIVVVVANMLTVQMFTSFFTSANPQYLPKHRHPTPNPLANITMPCVRKGIRAY